MEGASANKFTLFGENGGLQARLYDIDREQSSPKPQSARGDRSSTARSKFRNRPSSAQSARVSSADRSSRRYMSPNDRESRSVGGAVAAGPTRKGGADEAFYQLEREDLLNTCLELKKNQRITDAEIAKLKYENQRLETENLKAQRRIEKLISPQISKNGQTTTEIRRDIEKTAIVRQLKNQIHELRELLLSKDKLLDTMQKSQKATQLLELMAEKEEYHAEVQRLTTSLRTRDEDIQRLQGRGGGGNYRGSSIEDELRTEVSRLSAGYNELLTRLAQSEKERQLERIAQEEATMQIEAHMPIEPRSAKRNAGGRNQVKKTYHEPQPVPIKHAKIKRPSSAAAAGRSKKGGRGRSRDPSPGNRRPARHDDELIGDPAANDEWLSMTFGSGSIEPVLVAQPPDGRGALNLSPTKESGRPVTSRRGNPQPSDDEVPAGGTLPALDFSVGDKVSSRHSDRVGTVKAIDLLDMVCDLAYDDGQELRGISTADIILVSPRRKNRAVKDTAPSETNNVSSPSPRFKTSDKVNMVMSNSKRPGTVIKYHQKDNIYDIMLDRGGEIVYNVPAKCLVLREKASPKKVKPGPESSLPPLLNVGTPVNARYKGSDYWYPGVIREIEPGANSYAIHFDDGEIVTGVPTDHVDLKDGNGPANPASSGLLIDTRVDANYLNSGKWYPGRISLNRGGDAYDVAYDDGEREVGVTLDRLKVNGIVLAPPPSDPAAGAEVVYSSGNDVGHEVTDLPQEKNESPRPSKKPLSPRRVQPYSEGDDVEVNMSGEWKSGKLSKIYLRGYEVVYDVCIDDGSVKEGIGHDDIRHRIGGQNRCSHYFTLESQVEAYDTMLASWRLGTVKVLNTDGSYKITFTNGETSDSVIASYVRVVPEGSPDNLATNPGAQQASVPTEVTQPANVVPQIATEPVAADFEAETTPRGDVVLTKDITPLPVEPEAPPPLVKGSKVEANYRGQGKWYPGDIIREHPDGTVDIDYDDGERETRVKRDSVRHLGILFAFF